MFLEFFKLELRSAFKSPMVYVFLLLVALLTFGAVASDNVQIGGAVGNVYKNAPHTLTNFTLILGLIGLLFAAAFFNNAALRDHNNQFNEIMFSMPIKKSGYFFGRFLGALILSTIPLFGVFIGAWLGSIIGPAAGWVDSSRIGPFYFSTILNNYFIFILPNMFIAGSVIFFLAHKFKSTIISFVGAMGLVVAYLVGSTLLSDLDNQDFAALVDMFGIGTYSVHSRYFTPAERNTLSPMFEGLIAQNRMIWIAFGMVISFISYKVFSFREKKQFKVSILKDDSASEKIAQLTRPTTHQEFGWKLNWLQFKSFFKTNFISIVKSVVFKILAFFGVLLLFISLLEGYEYFGLQSYPVTYKVISDIAGSTRTFMLIIVVFFSGELVWRDRLANIHEVVNATPHQALVSIFARVASLVSVAVILQFIFIAMGIIGQLMRGYTDLELSVYLIDFFVDTVPRYIIFASLFVLVQSVLNNRYIGYFVGILFIFIWSIIIGSVFEWQSNMLFLGGSPGIFYSDMSGFGPGMLGTLWFNTYWILTAALFITIAALFWSRSVVKSLREKFHVARSNFDGIMKRTIGILGVLWLLVASFVFYNTQILNEYPSTSDLETLTVEYEQMYKKYNDYPLPVITAVKYNIDIYPNKRDVYVQADITLENDETSAIDSIFFDLNKRWNPKLEMDGMTLVMNDSLRGFQIYELNPAMQPGEKRLLKVNTAYITQGFENGMGNTSILSNGTFLNNFEILPSLGYSSNGEISDKNDRKKFGLPTKKRTEELVHDCGLQCSKNYITQDKAHWVDVETVISTSMDQIAVAPGSLIKEWEKDNRKYFHYKVDHPSLNFYSFMSARYEVARDKYNDIDVEIYHDPKHAVNVGMMIDAVKRSLEYYETNFGPYYHKQARILEFPRYSTFAQAFPGTMPYSEGFGFIVNLEDETENNVIDAVIAHEMAHQWWAHQEIPADMQGGTMLTESFSEYSSLMVMKQNSDDMKMKNFLKYDYDRYLRGRSSESEKELPLYQVENQQYIHYGKGSVILYALQDYIGEDSVNAAMRDFLTEYKYKGPPYPNSYDFLRHLEPKVPDSLQFLINDWFKEITLYDLRMEEASYVKLNDGRYEVSMDILAKKFHADTLGNETEVKLQEFIDIGVYADRDEEKLMAWKRISVADAQSTVKLIVDSLPIKAAIDPRRILMERITDDNVKVIESSED